MRLHERDQLVEVEGTTELTEVEAYCSARGYTLALDTLAEVSVATWIAEGTPGARSHYEDPADHVLAGLEGTLKNGKEIRIPPCPRRAAGPDWIALFAGQWGRFGKVSRAWIRVHAGTVTRPSFALQRDTNPKLTAMEEVMLLIVEKELS